MKRIASLAAALAALSFSSSAFAIALAGSDYTFNFTGQCTDCSGQGLGTLRVTNYVLGNGFSDFNFVSFQYQGTDLLAPFSIDAVTALGPVFLSGSIGQASGPYNVHLTGFNRFESFVDFNTSSDGSWNTGRPIADYGINGIWQQPDANPGVPEPATWISMITGFALAGGAMRRTKVRYSFT